MAIVKVLMMQKNEGNRLARWLAHYRALFGAENLIIFDNGSSDPLTLSLLDLAERQGCTVSGTLNTPHDFRHKGGHFTNVIRSLDHDFTYDFALPVDCDELLCVFTPEGLSCAPAAIHAEFERLKGYRGSFRIDMSMFNVPGQDGWFAPDRFFHKGFVPSHCSALIDDGHHAPASAELPEFITTRFTYLHWHNRPYAEMRDYAAAKLSLEIDDITDRERLMDHARQALPGGHLVRFLLQSEEDYLRAYQEEVQFFFAGNDLLIRSPQGLNFWDADKYLARHPDTAGYDPGLLSHYLMYGFREGRELA